jgi:hypothetical protein
MVIHMGNYFHEGAIVEKARLRWDITQFVRITPRMNELVLNVTDAGADVTQEVKPPNLLWFNSRAPHDTAASLLSNRFDENLIWAMHFFGRNQYTDLQAGVPPTWDYKLGGVYQFGDSEIGLDHLTNVSYLLALEMINAQPRKYESADTEGDNEFKFPVMLEQELARMKNVVIRIFEDPEPVAQNYDGTRVFDTVLNLLRLYEITLDEDYLNYARSFYKPYSNAIKPDLPVLQQMDEAQYVIPNWVGLAGAKMLIANQIDDDEMFNNGHRVLKRILSWGEVPPSGGEFNPVKTALYFRTIRGNRRWMEIDENPGYNVDPELWSGSNLFIAHALLELAKITDDADLVRRGRNILLNVYLGPEAGYTFRLWDDTTDATGKQYGGFYTKYDVKREELIGDTKFVEPLFFAQQALNSYRSLFPYGDGEAEFEYSLTERKPDLTDLTYGFIRREAYQPEYNGFFMEMGPKWEKPIEPPFTEAQGRYLIDAGAIAYGLVAILSYQNLPGSMD